jgi:hypothetical protein
MSPLKVPAIGKYNITLALGPYLGDHASQLICILRSIANDKTHIMTGRTIWANIYLVICEFDFDLDLNSAYEVGLSPNGVQMISSKEKISIYQTPIIYEADPLYLFGN